MTLFRIDKNSKFLLLNKEENNSSAKEKDIEEIVFNSLKQNQEEVTSKIFGEGLIFPINRQQRYKTGKISDILALDGEGRVVIIELKRAFGKIGVEMQALQYLVQIKSYPTGWEFFTNGGIKCSDKDDLEKISDAFSGDDRAKINKEQRIILIARDFEESLFSMGEWLSEKGIGFTCISYDIYNFNDEEFISFSTKFDSKPYNSYQLGKSADTSNNTNVPYYYHNSGSSKEEVIQLINNGVIGCGFDGKLFDQGYNILNNKYNKGDKIFLYQNGFGIMAVGSVKNDKLPNKDDNNYYLNKGYKLLSQEELVESPIKLPHTLQVDWGDSFTLDPKKAFSREKIKEFRNDGILLPIPKTSSAISRDQLKAENFYKAVKDYFLGLK